MSVQGSNIFLELGLTYAQVRVYLALVRLKLPSTAKQISAYIEIARQDVYHTLTELQELSLVETIIGSPAMYRAIVPKKAVKILMERRDKKTNVMLEEAKELLTLNRQTEPKVQQEKERFVLIPKKEATISRIEEAIGNSKKRILVVTPWREATQWLFILHDAWSKALSRSVEIQWMTQNEGATKMLSKNMQALIKKPNFKLQTQPLIPLSIRLMLFDSREVFLATDKAPNAGEAPALWSNNPLVVCVLNDYFETKWGLLAERRFEERLFA